MLKKFKNRKEKNKGFTLLELMVVISIIGIMTSVGLVSLSSSRKDMLLKTSQDEVISAIKLAQSYALQGKVVPSETSKICGFGFKFTTDTEYEIFYYNTASSDCTGGKNENYLEGQELKSGVKLTDPSPDDSKIYFSLPSARVTASGGVPKTFGLNSEKTVTINSFGLVTKN